MKKVIRQNLPFEYHEYPRDKALQLNADEPLKLEIINDIPDGEIISTYKHGEFEDLCAGPHVESTGKIPAFKLINVAGAYWRGDEHRPMLQRIYGTSFETEANWDFVDVYAGTRASDANLASCHGTECAGATGTGSSVLVRFTSDGSVVRQRNTALVGRTSCK